MIFMESLYLFVWDESIFWGVDFFVCLFSLSSSFEAVISLLAHSLKKDSAAQCL